MTRFSNNIAPFVNAELALAKQCRMHANAQDEFKHLENAHVLGQESTFHHVRVHCLMLYWGVRQRRRNEVLGQVLRVFGALTKTAIGLVPKGNTGGANISPFKPLPVNPDLQQIITAAKG